MTRSRLNFGTFRISKLAAGASALALVSSVAMVATSGASSNSTAVSSVNIAVGKVGVPSQQHTMASVCGTKPVDVGVVDGYGINAWSQLVKASIVDAAATCKSIKRVDYVAGQGSLATTTAGITSLAAKGDKIILVIPDAGTGASQLPAIRAATKAGSYVIPFAQAPAGTAGKDFLDYVDQSPPYSGQVWASWMVKRLGKKGGNVVFLGGPAGNAVSSGELIGINQVLKKNPQVKLLNATPVTTNWDPAMAQTAMTGLLSQYHNIAGVMTDYGAVATGVIRAYQAAGLKLVPISATDQMSLSCGFNALKAKNPNYQLVTVSSRTWAGEAALRKGLAAFEGLPDTEPSIYNLPAFEDSTGGTPGSILPSKACKPGVPGDASPSSGLTVAQLKKVFG